MSLHVVSILSSLSFNYCHFPSSCDFLEPPVHGSINNLNMSFVSLRLLLLMRELFFCQTCCNCSTTTTTITVWGPNRGYLYVLVFIHTDVHRHKHIYMYEYGVINFFSLQLNSSCGEKRREKKINRCTQYA